MTSKYENLTPNPTITLIEDASSGISLKQALIGEIKNLHSIPCKGTKEQRFNIVTLKTEQGILLFPQQAASWFKDFEDEFLTFPRSFFKDQCDALSQAINYISDGYRHQLYNCNTVAVRKGLSFYSPERMFEENRMLNLSGGRTTTPYGCVCNDVAARSDPSLWRKK